MSDADRQAIPSFDAAKHVAYPDALTRPARETILVLGTEADGQSTKVSFHVYGRQVGILHLDSPMRFEGDADKSAMAFMETVIAYWKGKATVEPHR